MTDPISRIEPDEVINLALALGNIDSPSGAEGPAAEYVFDWLTDAGFAPRRHGMVTNRFNVSATIEGLGGGYSLIFNGHLDTTLPAGAIWSARNPRDPLYRSAWLDGEWIVGDGVVNDKGPVAAFLVAAKAIRESGRRLKGDLTVTAVVGEIGMEPVDEFQAPEYLSKDLGARYMINHGVVADFALVAEGTGFGIVWVEPGMAQFKLTILSDEPRYYTPYLPRPTSLADSPNAIVRAAAVVAEIERWALEYQQRFRQERVGGTIVPKVSINAIRGGYPFALTSTPQVCGLYLDTYLPPGANPNDIKTELRAVLAAAGSNGTVELTTYRPGFEAVGVERLVDAVRRSHGRIFDAAPEPVGVEVTSMWRDTNAFIELGIPALSYAPRASSHAARKAIRASDLVNAARVYALVALDLCDQERAPWAPLGSHVNTVFDASKPEA